LPLNDFPNVSVKRAIYTKYYEISREPFDASLHAAYGSSGNASKMNKTAFFAVSKTANHVIVYRVCVARAACLCPSADSY